MGMCKCRICMNSEFKQGFVEAAPLTRVSAQRASTVVLSEIVDERTISLIYQNLIAYRVLLLKRLALI